MELNVSIQVGKKHLAAMMVLFLATSAVASINFRDSDINFNSPIDMQGNEITSLADPSQPDSAAPASWTGDNFVNKSGDNITGDLNLNENQITNLSNPDDPGDVPTKEYVDNNAGGAGEIVLNRSTVYDSASSKQNYTVPRWADEVEFQVLGGSGGDGGRGTAVSNGGPGGEGGMINGTIEVQGGETLGVYVGETGEDGDQGVYSGNCCDGTGGSGGYLPFRSGLSGGKGGDGSSASVLGNKDSGGGGGGGAPSILFHYNKSRIVAVGEGGGGGGGEDVLDSFGNTVDGGEGGGGARGGTGHQDGDGSGNGGDGGANGDPPEGGENGGTYTDSSVQNQSSGSSTQGPMVKIVAIAKPEKSYRTPSHFEASASVDPSSYTSDTVQERILASGVIQGIRIKVDGDSPTYNYKCDHQNSRIWVKFETTEGKILNGSIDTSTTSQRFNGADIGAENPIRRIWMGYEISLSTGTVGDCDLDIKWDVQMTDFE